MTGTITKRKTHSGISWGYCFLAGRDAQGNRDQRTKSGFKTKGEAEQALRDAIGAHQQEKKKAECTEDLRTFGQFLPEWLENRSKKVAGTTIQRYEALGVYALRYLAETPLRHITTRQLEEMVLDLKERGGRRQKPLAAKTVNEIAFVVNGVFKTAVRWKIVRENPMPEVERPRVVKEELKIFNREQFREILEAAKDHWLYPILLTAASTGARRGELAALTWEDVDFKAGSVHIVKSLEQTKKFGLRLKPPKNNKRRRFALPPILLEVLAEHGREQQRRRRMFGASWNKLDLIFPDVEGNYLKPDSLTAKVSLLCNKLGLKGLSLHSFRHTHASELLSLGVPLPTVSKRLGHANPAITLSIYSHALETDEVAAAQVWNDALASSVAKQRSGTGFTGKSLEKSSFESAKKPLSIVKLGT